MSPKPVPPIAIVDDEPAIRRVLRQHLTGAGFRVLEFVDGVEAVEQIPASGAALVLLDVDMPRMNGWATLRELRHRQWDGAVLMVTNYDAVPDRVRGLEDGADDYLGKPFDCAELVARVKALLRRSAKMEPKPGRVLRLGDTLVDFERQCATRNGAPLSLTRKEFAVLAMLQRHKGRPVPREQLLLEIWEIHQDVQSHTLDTHIWRLRKKIGDTGRSSGWIRNLPGQGYALAPEAAI
ncbi:MAG TPA: response regulator transcription factor [Opitutaceae bacterium]|nr:response regulator transcription factor [Opitutaceae bacterium]